MRDYTWVICCILGFINGTKNRQVEPICTTKEKNIDLEQRLEKKFKVVKRFNNLTNNVKTVISYLEKNVTNQKRKIRN